MDMAIKAARAAGRVAMEYYRSKFDVQMKPDRTPVTQADKEAERVMIEMLRNAFPDYGVLGEEFGAQGPKEIRWIIDPIDGTKNFIRRIPFWSVLLALEEHGEVTAGVVHNPVTGELYHARKGKGAYANGERIRVSTVDALDTSLLCHASLNLIRRAGYWDGMVRLIDATERQRGWGEYYGYAVVAKGQAEISVEADLKPWDIAAVKILVEEAGGRFTDLDGAPTIYSGTALATNGKVHDAVLACFRPSR